MHKLIISDDEGKTTVVPLVRDEITIGRKEGNTIRLTERNVSRRHARLVRANGSFQIEDLGSYNGIRLNGVRIADKSSVKEGDQIQIGDYQLALQSDKAVAKPVPAAEEAVTVATALPAPADAATEVIAVPAEETVPVELPPVNTPARLVLVSAPAPGQDFTLAKDETVIGRAEECDVSINHRSMSREHAKILRVEQAYRILDLESANGVRVNGQDVPYAELHRGDVIELGHVRLRFVAPGEVYRFDGDATIQMSAAMGAGRSSRTPIWVLAAALLLAGGVGLYLASRPVEPATPARPTPPSVPNPVPPTVPVADVHHDIDVGTLLESARQALREGRFDDAMQAASQALAQEHGNADAERLVHDIPRQKEAALHFGAGNDKLEAHDPEGALAEFDQIPAGTEQYDLPAVVELVQRVLRARLEEANIALGRQDLGHARELATGVRDHQRVNGDGNRELAAIRATADALLRRIDERERLAQASPVPDSGQGQQQRQREQEQRQREQEQRQRERQQEQQQQQQQEQQGQQQVEVPSGANPRDCGPVANATAARCFLAATGGNGSGEYMMRNLILAHTLLGDRGRARAIATRYFADYGTSPFARQIRQLGYSP